MGQVGARGIALGDADDPATDGFVITPNDSTDLVVFTRGIVVSATVAVRMTLVNMADGEYIDPTLAAGVIHPYAVRRLWSTGTGTATIIGVR